MCLLISQYQLIRAASTGSRTHVTEVFIIVWWCRYLDLVSSHHPSEPCPPQPRSTSPVMSSTGWNPQQFLVGLDKIENRSSLTPFFLEKHFQRTMTAHYCGSWERKLSRISSIFAASCPAPCWAWTPSCCRTRWHPVLQLELQTNHRRCFQNHRELLVENTYKRFHI